MKLEIGELITLENNKEYICIKKTTFEGKDYVYLVSNFKPLEIRFAEESIENKEVYVTVVEDADLKNKLLNEFNSD